MYKSIFNFNIPSFDKSDVAFGVFTFLSISCGILSYYYTSETLKQADEYCNEITTLKKNQVYVLYDLDILKDLNRETLYKLDDLDILKKLNQQTVYKIHDLMLNVNAAILNKKYDVHTQTDTNLSILKEEQREMGLVKTHSDMETQTQVQMISPISKADSEYFVVDAI